MYSYQHLIIYFSLLIGINSCAFKTKVSGGDQTLPLNIDSLPESELIKVANGVVMKEVRSPNETDITKLYHPLKNNIKKIGIVLFETQIQPTRSGLTNDRSIYLSDIAKELMTEKLYQNWEAELSNSIPELQLISKDQVVSAKSASLYGFEYEYPVMGEKTQIDEVEAFYLPGGKKVSMRVTFMPKGFRDLSLLLVPGMELMHGPKPIEHQKQWINDLCKELKLDAVLIISMSSYWQREGKDKRTNEVIPEKIFFENKLTLAVPFSKYENKLKKKATSLSAKKTIALFTLTTKHSEPIQISVPLDQENFNSIEKNLLQPFFKREADLIKMMVLKLKSEFNG